jgi:flagellar biosynthesis GTPase FlhF
MYEAMIDISDVSDGKSSIHRTRFTQAKGFDAGDLEAVAHHLFDNALAVHLRGWNRPQTYHKKVVRGKLLDLSERSIETRLARITMCLRHRKATVDDAMRGGVTLSLLVDNPEARGFTKMSNNAGNQKRGERLKAAPTVTTSKTVQKQQPQQQPQPQPQQEQEQQYEEQQQQQEEFQEAFQEEQQEEFDEHQQEEFDEHQQEEFDEHQQEEFDEHQQEEFDEHQQEEFDEHQQEEFEEEQQEEFEEQQEEYEEEYEDEDRDE